MENKAIPHPLKNQTKPCFCQVNIFSKVFVLHDFCIS